MRKTKQVLRLIGLQSESIKIGNKSIPSIYIRILLVVSSFITILSITLHIQHEHIFFNRISRELYSYIALASSFLLYLDMVQNDWIKDTEDAFCYLQKYIESSKYCGDINWKLINPLLY